MTTHELKILPEYYEAIKSGEKTFDVRYDDRGFQVGDIIVFDKYVPKYGYIEIDDEEECLSAEIIYILNGGQYGIKKGYCVLGIVKEQSKDIVF